MSATATISPPPGVSTSPDERVLDVLRRYAQHSDSFLTYNDATSHFFDPDIDGSIAYRVAGRHDVIQLCGPFCAPADRMALLSAFKAWARRERRTITAIQLRPVEAQEYAAQGFVANQFGTTFTIATDGFTLAGTQNVKVRNKISRARRAGVYVEELPPELHLSSELDHLDRVWLGAKGKTVHELDFMVGERGGRGRPHRRLFVARQRERLVGYALYAPCFGAQPGWLYDLSRRDPHGPPGVAELIFGHAIEQLRYEGAAWMHLGLTPFVGLEDRHELPGSCSRVMRAVGRRLLARGLLFPAESQQDYKLKWHPSVLAPDYIAWEHGPRLAATWHLARVTRAIAW